MPSNGFTVNALLSSSLSGNNNVPNLNSNILPSSNINSNLKSSLDSIFTNNFINPSLFQHSLPVHQQRPNSIGLTNNYILEPRNENNLNFTNKSNFQNQQIIELSQPMAKSM